MRAHVAAYVVGEEPRYFSPLHAAHRPLPKSYAGQIVVSIGPTDPDGDLPVVFSDGSTEDIAWSDLQPLDGPEATFRADLMDRCLYFYSEDEYEAFESYRAILAQRDRLIAAAVKVCSKCGEEKPFSAFGSNVTRPDALAAACKDCEKVRDAGRR